MPVRFRYYITDLYDGCVKGTDDEAVVRACRTSEDFFVVDTETNEWLQPNDESRQIEELKLSQEDLESPAGPPFGEDSGD